MAIAVIVIILCLLMCSCRTTKTLTETLIVHDTVQSVRTDTIRDVRMVTVHDSTHQITERVITLKESGDTLRILVNNNIERIIQKTDSLDRYRHISDSLKAVLDMEQSKTKNESSKAEKRLLIITYLSLIFISLAVIATGILCFKQFKKHK